MNLHTVLVLDCIFGLKTHVRNKNQNNNNNDDIANSLKDTLSGDENLKLKITKKKVVTKRASSAHSRKLN